jgi:hypothetical protein
MRPIVKFWNSVWKNGGMDSVRDMAEFFGLVCPICGNVKQTGDGRVSFAGERVADNRFRYHCTCGECGYQWDSDS